MARKRIGKKPKQEKGKESPHDMKVAIGKKYSGRPKKCDNVPKENACRKTKAKGGMYCINCTAG